MKTTRNRPFAGLAAAAALVMGTTPVAYAANPFIDDAIGPKDNNAATNPLLQPDPAVDPAPDQSMQFGEIMNGRAGDDEFVYGGLGTDLIFGNRGSDVLMGGPEHFNPLNRDRAFGGQRHDIFVWQPGDGSDRFEGGEGRNAVVFGLIAQDDDGDRILFDPDDGIDANGNVAPNFRVRRDEQAGVVLMRFADFLPLVDVSASPGFCEIIDPSTVVPGVADTAAALEDIGVDHLIRFRLRNGQLAVTVQVTDVDVVICGGVAAGTVDIIDLRKSPPIVHTDVGATDIDLPPGLPPSLEIRLNQMLTDFRAEILAGNGEPGVAIQDF